MAAASIEGLIAEQLSVKEIVKLTGLDRTTIRRLRQPETDNDPDTGDDRVGRDYAAKGAAAEVES